MSRKKTSKLSVPKKRKLSSYKKKAWTAFSKYIRTRDCLKTTRTINTGRCVTCHKVFSISELQAGHAIAGRNNAILFDEELVNAQCAGCNYRGGEQAKYSLWFIKTYGLPEWEKKVILKDQCVRYKPSDYEELYRVYTDKLKRLLDGKMGSMD